jgi:hypothetical protein
VILAPHNASSREQPIQTPEAGEWKTVEMVDKMSGARAARVSSPASTGGAGTTFEQHAAAYWLAQLLVRGIPPILVDTIVIEVCF